MAQCLLRGLVSLFLVLVSFIFSLGLAGCPLGDGFLRLFGLVNGLLGIAGLILQRCLADALGRVHEFHGLCLRS